MVRFSTFLSTISLAFALPGSLAHTVQAVISSTADLSVLNSIITQYPTLLANLTSAGGTFLAPSNDAINNFIASSGGDLASISEATIFSLVQYHILPLELKSADLSIQGGALAQTSLLDSAFANLAGTANVIFASSYGSTGQESAPSGLKIYSGVGLAANVTLTDLAFENGFVHVIDKVLNFPQPCTKTAQAASLSTLLTALQTTNLTEVVDTTPKFTCFAPTDEAFQKAGIDLTKLTKDQIADALKYHSIVGDVGYSTAFEDGKQYQTLLGKPVTVHKRDGQLFINDVAVQVGNVIMSNGVAHVLSGVLSPPTGNATTTGTGTGAGGSGNGTATGTAAGASGTSAATSVRINAAYGSIAVVAAGAFAVVSGMSLSLF